MNLSIKKLGIIQPGKIGDIIICLPIAKYYFKKGYEIIWPIDKHIINNFVNHVNYVKFIPIDFNCISAKKICIENECCNHVIDLSFNIPGSSEKNTKLFTGGQLCFDELKYQIADVPLEERWNLSITRNIEREEKLFSTLNSNGEEYILTHWQGSTCRKTLAIQDVIKQIEANPITDSIFDWILLLEKAKGFITIASCFSVLIDQLGLQQPKILLSRQDLPTYKQHWKII